MFLLSITNMYKCSTQAWAKLAQKILCPFMPLSGRLPEGIQPPLRDERLKEVPTSLVTPRIHADKSWQPRTTALTGGFRICFNKRSINLQVLPMGLMT
mmetsp:Transcript_34271/g.62143  ORF Transcript_34271/g.62143 Transcript_34271/m.62143 type:complete len:98 (+) Transcript_34271:64-357(+)